jgi:hypothetical protein
MSDPKQVSVFEAEAYGAALRAAGHVAATENALTEVGNALEMANRSDLTREVGKVAELHRLCAARLAGIIRRLGEGGVQ